MAKKLFVKINMFDANQSIFLADENDDIKLIATPSINEINNIVFGLISPSSEDDSDIKEIEFNGNEKYIKNCGQDILNELVRKYSNRRDLRVLINGKILN